MADDPYRPWNGADRDKERHPRLGRLVDNIWVLTLNRIVFPSLGAAFVGVFAWGVGKVDTLDDVARQMPALVKSINDVGQKLEAEMRSQDIVVEQVKRAEKDIVGLRADLTRDEGAINDSKAEAASAKARVDDIKEELGEIKKLASQNLAVSQSHDADIRATRAAVAPQPTSPPY